MTLTYANGRALSAAEIDRHAGDLATNGYTIIPNALDTDRIRPAVAAMERVYERERAIAERLGTQSVHALSAHNVVGKDPFFETFYLNPAVLAVLRRALGDDMILYDCTARSIQPSHGRESRRGFSVHTDRAPHCVEPFVGGKHYPVSMNVIWALVDFTEENGATRVWPGTHLSLAVPDPDSDYPDAGRAVMPAGSALISDAALWHATGVNRSDHIRHSLLGHFHRVWLRGMITNEHVIAPNVRARLVPEMRQLLGLERRLPDYSELKRFTGDEIENWSPWEKEVGGIGIY